MLVLQVIIIYYQNWISQNQGVLLERDDTSEVRKAIVLQFRALDTFGM